MSKQSQINRLLQVKKSTGEILTAKAPHYRGQFLDDVYTTHSVSKSSAFYYCLDLLNRVSDRVLSYGITSNNTFQFTFAGVFETDDVKYVLICTRSYDKIYLLEED